MNSSVLGRALPHAFSGRCEKLGNSSVNSQQSAPPAPLRRAAPGNAGRLSVSAAQVRAALLITLELQLALSPAHAVARMQLLPDCVTSPMDRLSSNGMRNPALMHQMATERPWVGMATETARAPPRQICHRPWQSPARLQVTSLPNSSGPASGILHPGSHPAANGDDAGR